MKETRYYEVAGDRFGVSGEGEGCANYELFACNLFQEWNVLGKSRVLFLVLLDSLGDTL